MIHTFEDAVNLEGEDREKEIIERLRKYSSSALIGIAKYAFICDGLFDYCDVFRPEDIDDYGFKAYEIMHAMFYGNVRSLNDYIRFDAYGNLESVSGDDLYEKVYEDIDEITQWLFDNSDQWEDCGLYTEDISLFNAWEDIDYDKQLESSL